MRRSKKKNTGKATTVIPQPDEDGVRRTDFRFDDDTLALLMSLIGEEDLEETTEEVWKYDNSDELPPPPDGAVLVDYSWKSFLYEYEGIIYHLRGDGLHEGYELYYTNVSVDESCEGTIEANILPEFRGLPVTEIRYDAFMDCKSLESVTIPDSVTSIGDSAFQGCTSLTSIIIPDSVTGNLVLTFQGCESLEYAVIGSGVEGLSSFVFECCYSLKYVYFTSSVEWMSATAFRACSSLTDIYFYGTQEEFENIELAHGDFDTWIDNDYYPNATKHYLLDPVKAESSPYER